MSSNGGVIGVFSALEEAEEAVRRLDEHGFAIGNISIPVSVMIGIIK